MFDFPEVPRDTRWDSTTVTLGEWYEMGFFRPLEDDWAFDAYSAEQRTRLCDKFLRRYYYREVGITTPARWKAAYLRKLDEIMPKYKILYERVEQGINPMQAGRERSKSRDIFSDFPETMLSGNSDYASSGTDRESDTVREGDVTEHAARFADKWNDVDVMILDELEHVLFTAIMVPTVPLW